MTNVPPTLSADANTSSPTVSDKISKSSLLSMSQVLSPNPLTTPSKIDHTKVPGHIANILKVILLHDKFEHNFSKWSLVQTEDRDVLILTLKNSAIVESSLVYTICMMYPFRINGPIMIKNTMHVEFLHENPLEIVHVTGDIQQKNVEYSLGTFIHNRKRHRPPSPSDTMPTSSNDTQQTTSSLNMLDLNILLIRKKLSSALLLTNSTRVFVEQVDTGLDAGGSWVKFRLSECDKLNLDFIGAFQLSIDDVPVKVAHSFMSFHFIVLYCPFFLTWWNMHSRCNYTCRQILRLVYDFIPQQNAASLLVGNLCQCIHRKYHRRLLQCAHFVNTYNSLAQCQLENHILNNLFSKLLLINQT